MLTLGFAILGFLGLALAVVAVRSNRRRVASGAATARWLAARRWSGPVGFVLGIGSYFISYPVQDQGETWRIAGFPFLAAAFDPRGSDYVGITTVPALIGNFLFFLAIPQLILWACGRRRGRGAWQFLRTVSLAAWLGSGVRHQGGKYVVSSEQMEKWRATRQRGMLRFVLMKGVLSYGLVMFLVMTFVVNRDEITSSSIAAAAVGWTIGGVVFGVLLWLFQERRFRKAAGNSA